MMGVAPQIAQNEAACQLDRAEFEIGDSKLLHLRQWKPFGFAFSVTTQQSSRVWTKRNALIASSIKYMISNGGQPDLINRYS